MMKRTTKSVIQEIKQVHGNRYIIPSDFQYINKRTKLHLICPKHGDFYPYYDNLIKKKCQCRKCLYHIYTTQEFREDVQKQYPNNELDFSLVEYKGYRKDVIIKCNLCNKESIVKPIRLLNGTFQCNCQKASRSTLEKMVRNTLLEKKIDFEEQKKFEWLGKQSLDFYLPKYDIAIECQGKQHFGLGGWSKNFDFETQHKRDELKYNLCRGKGIEIVYFTDVKPYQISNDYFGKILFNKNTLLDFAEYLLLNEF